VDAFPARRPSLCTHRGGSGALGRSWALNLPHPADSAAPRRRGSRPSNVPRTPGDQTRAQAGVVIPSEHLGADVRAHLLRQTQHRRSLPCSCERRADRIWRTAWRTRSVWLLYTVWQASGEVCQDGRFHSWMGRV
jgi:hypothetical protein